MSVHACIVGACLLTKHSGRRFTVFIPATETTLPATLNLPYSSLPRIPEIKVFREALCTDACVCVHAWNMHTWNMHACIYRPRMKAGVDRAHFEAYV